ncbi:MAG: energy transducer TonB [Thermoanaerobaculia bacterium]|nr:energy transducer TonB [Thermoanaerobaculia bacterium]
MNGATAKIRGRVVLDILIDRSGDVRCVSILKGLPMGLDEAARSAAFGWRFSPAPKLQRTLVEVSFGHIAQPPLTPSDSRLTNR